MSEERLTAERPPWFAKWTDYPHGWLDETKARAAVWYAVALEEQLARLREENAALKAERFIFLEALKLAEWTPANDKGASYCNCCGRDKWNGHNSVCRVAAAIAELSPITEGAPPTSERLHCGCVVGQPPDGTCMDSFHRMTAKGAISVPEQGQSCASTEVERGFSDRERQIFRAGLKLQREYILSQISHLVTICPNIELTDRALDVAMYVAGLKPEGAE